MKQNKLDELKGKNPFKLPESYFEGLTGQIMAQIPEASHKEAKVVSLRDRIRPWLYSAAVFAGLLICLRIFIMPGAQKTEDRGETYLYVQALVSDELLQVVLEEDIEYLEFMENQYFDRIFAEEIDSFADEPDEIEDR